MRFAPGWLNSTPRSDAGPVLPFATALPADTYDVITAMDVFEHLTDPVGAVEDLTRALRPGGYLYGRFHGETDAQRPQHIVCDFTPTFARLADLGMREVWRDGWLWGHQVFQRV